MIDAHKSIRFAGLVAVVLALAGWAIPAHATTLGVDPSVTVVSSPGETFSVDVIIPAADPVTDLYQGHFVLSYEATALTVTGITGGAFLSSTANILFFLPDFTVDGVADVAWSYLGTNPGATGSGVLATISFAVDSLGGLPTDLTLGDVQLLNRSGGAIPFTVQNGAVEAIPEPASVALLLGGLLAAAFARRRNPQI